MNKKYILLGFGVLGIMFLMANTSKSNNTNQSTPPKTDGNKYLPEGYKQGDPLPTNYRPGALKVK